jgi:hypothetical protein
VLAGLMIIISAMHAQGTDLRPARNTDLVSLVQSQSRHNTELTRQLAALRTASNRICWWCTSKISRLW